MNNYIVGAYPRYVGIPKENALSSFHGLSSELSDLFLISQTDTSRLSNVKPVILLSSKDASVDEVTSQPS